MLEEAQKSTNNSAIFEQLRALKGPSSSGESTGGLDPELDPGLKKIRAGQLPQEDPSSSGESTGGLDPELDPGLKKIRAEQLPQEDPSSSDESMGGLDQLKIQIIPENYKKPEKGPVAVLNLSTGKKTFFSPKWFPQSSFEGPKFQENELQEFMDELKALSGTQTEEQRLAHLLFIYFKKLYNWNIAELDVPKPHHSAELGK
ncbi:MULTISPECIES: hypothetical protein [Legionella]|uniref:hypothetical protein n=1 Tax=Legionella TaxID=445 RepID=UPI0010551F1D|nr:hypothetical protein [Legionella maceachernii]